MDAGDGAGYIISPRGTSAFEVYCNFSLSGGGWTMIASAATGGPNWNNTSIKNQARFGNPTGAEDHKSRAWNRVFMRDLMFENGPMHAVYGDVHDGGDPYYQFQAAIPQTNCGLNTPYEFQMTDGNLSFPRLCNTNLYFNVADHDGSVSNCSWDNEAYGPGWNTYNNAGSCPLDDPDGSTFWTNYWGDSPWQNTRRRMYVR